MNQKLLNWWKQATHNWRTKLLGVLYILSMVIMANRLADCNALHYEVQMGTLMGAFFTSLFCVQIMNQNLPDVDYAIYFLTAMSFFALVLFWSGSNCSEQVGADVNLVTFFKFTTVVLVCTSAYVTYRPKKS